MTSPSIARRLFASLVSALATGLAVFAVVFLTFYIAEGAAITDVSGLVQAFGPSSIVAIVLFVVLALFGGLTTVRRVLVCGLVVGVVSAYVGTVVFLVLHNVEFTTGSDNAFRDLLGYNLPFVVLTVVLALSIFRRVYAWAFGLRVVAPPRVHRLALVRAPATTLAKGQVTHVKRRVVKFEKLEGCVTCLSVRIR